MSRGFMWNATLNVGRQSCWELLKHNYFGNPIKLDKI